MPETPLPLFTRFARGVFWTISGSIASRLFTFASTLIAARLLAKVGFGQLGMIQSTIGLLGVFAGFGIGLTATKYIAELKDKDPARVGRIIALASGLVYLSGGIATLVCFFAAPWLAAHTLNAPELATELKLAAILLLLSAVSGVQFGGLSGFQAFRTLAKINFWQGLLSLPITIPCVYLFGLRGAILALILSTLISLVFSSWALRRECASAGIKVKLREAWSESPILWRYSLPATLSAALVVPVGWAANALLVNQPQGYAELGLFNAANQFRVFLLYFPNLLGLVIVPFLSEIHGQGDPQNFARMVNLNLTTTWSFLLPIGFLAIGLNSWLMGLFGPQFRGGRLVFALMVNATMIYLALNAIGQAISGSGQMWAGFLTNLGWALAFFLAALYFIPKMGALGLALSYLIAYLFHIAWTLGYAAWRYGHSCLQSVPLLAVFNGVAILLTMAIGKLPEPVIVAVSLLFALGSGLYSCHLLPPHYRQRLWQTMGRGAV